MQELWQLYDEQGKPIPGKGAHKDEVYKGLLHGAAHVWIWRSEKGQVEILLQKRASTKRTWPNLFDISAAGHIDLGESPEQAAVRETHEEIGLNIEPKDLKLVQIHKTFITAPGGSIENEFRWVYALELKQKESFQLQSAEVAQLAWIEFNQFKDEVLDPELKNNYAPQGDDYFQTLIAFLKQQV